MTDDRETEMQGFGPAFLFSFGLRLTISATPSGRKRILSGASHFFPTQNSERRQLHLRSAFCRKPAKKGERKC